MLVNTENNKYDTEAEYFYNDYLDLYCVVGTTIAMQYLDELKSLWEAECLLTEVPMPDYITADYDGNQW